MDTGARILDFQAGRRWTREKEADSWREKMQVISYDDDLDYGRVNIMSMIKTLRLQALAGRLLDLESQMLSLWEKSSFYFIFFNNVNLTSTWGFISKIKSMQIIECGCQS